MDVIGVVSYSIEFNEDLRKRDYWDIGCEKDFEKGIKEELTKVELSKLKPLTLDKIADAILMVDIPGKTGEKDETLATGTKACYGVNMDNYKYKKEVITTYSKRKDMNKQIYRYFLNRFYPIR